MKNNILNIKIFVNILKFFLVIFIFTLLFLNLTSPAYAAPCDSANPNPVDCPAGLTQIEDMFRNLISVVVGMAFIAMVVLLVWAGIKYLTSGGEAKALAAAHAVVTWALLGIIFMAVAWLILLLLKAFTGIDVTVFDIQTLCWGDNPADPAKPFPFCK